MIDKSIVIIVGALFFIEGLIVAASPEWARKVTLRLLKNMEAFRTIGIIELLIGLALVLLGIYLNF